MCPDSGRPGLILSLFIIMFSGNSVLNTQDKIHFYHSASTWMEGRAVEQLKQTAALPGVTAAAGMPDLHPGLSAPVGAAVQTEKIIGSSREFVGKSA